MAKIRVRQGRHDVIKERYVTKKTFKRLIIALVASLTALGGSLARLYYLGDFNPIITQLTTYYKIFEGLF